VSSTELVIKSTGEVATAEAINTYLTAILDRVPDQDEGDVTGIIAQIINAEDSDGLDSPWQSAGMKKFRNHAVRIDSIKKLESEFAEGLPFYLLCEGVVLETGEYQALTTSSVQIMAQILVAWDKGLWPLTVYPRVATKPTKKGFYPMHLEIYRGGALVDHPEDEQAPTRRMPASSGRPREARTTVPRQNAAGAAAAATEAPAGADEAGF
jgi:hypothetical protein